MRYFSPLSLQSTRKKAVLVISGIWRCDGREFLPLMSMCAPSVSDVYPATTGLPTAETGGKSSGLSSVTHQYSKPDSRPSST